MSCMEHECKKCGWFMMDNLTWKNCPSCNSPVTNWFDEANDQREESCYEEEDYSAEGDE